MCILMVIEILAVVYLYSTVDGILNLADMMIWEEFIHERKTDLNNSNELHRMQRKVSECH